MSLEKFFYDLMIGIMGGVISGLIVTWILKSELGLLLSKDSIKRIFTRELLVGLTLIIGLAAFVILVQKGIISPPRFDDSVIRYDLEGNEYVSDSKGTRPTGVKRNFDRENKFFEDKKSDSASESAGFK